jgi:hypothetical protein
MRYALLPVIEGASGRKFGFDVLVAADDLDESVALTLAEIQLFNWYARETDNERLRVLIHLRPTAKNASSLFDRLGVNFAFVDDEGSDWSEPGDIAAVASAVDADIIILSNADQSSEIDDEQFESVIDITKVLYAAEVHARGFDLPWSFESPMKGLSWSSFYMMTHRTVFEPLLREHHASQSASAEVTELMRALIYNSLPLLFFCRDRLAFYRQQQRAGRRWKLERQDFAFEYAAYLNLFYLAFYSTTDQIANLVNLTLGLGLSESDVGPIYKNFKRELQSKDPNMADNIFAGTDFWKMYRMPRLARHYAAHHAPLMPTSIYTGDDNITDAELEAKALELGYLDHIDIFPPHLQADIRATAHYKAKLALWDRSFEHALVLRDGKKMLIWYPDPTGDLDRLMAFLWRVLGALPTW